MIRCFVSYETRYFLSTLIFYDIEEIKVCSQRQMLTNIYREFVYFIGIYFFCKKKYE